MSTKQYKNHMKKIMFITVALIAGCDAGNKSQTRKPQSEIVLKCEGEQISGANRKRESTSYLIKLEDTPRQPSLSFYNENEKRFVASACLRNFSECQATLDPDMITEYGVLNSSKDSAPSMKIKTSINRRTGEMRIATYDPTFGEQTSFEGQCKKASHPAETPQKF